MGVLYKGRYKKHNWYASLTFSRGGTTVPFTTDSIEALIDQSFNLAHSALKGSEGGYVMVWISQQERIDTKYNGKEAFHLRGLGGRYLSIAFSHFGVAVIEGADVVIAKQGLVAEHPVTYMLYDSFAQSFCDIIHYMPMSKAQKIAKAVLLKDKPLKALGYPTQDIDAYMKPWLAVKDKYSEGIHVYYWNNRKMPTLRDKPGLLSLSDRKPLDYEYLCSYQYDVLQEEKAAAEALAEVKERYFRAQKNLAYSRETIRDNTKGCPVCGYQAYWVWSRGGMSHQSCLCCDNSAGNGYEMPVATLYSYGFENREHSSAWPFLKGVDPEMDGYLEEYPNAAGFRYSLMGEPERINLEKKIRKDFFRKIASLRHDWFVTEKARWHGGDKKKPPAQGWNAARQLREAGLKLPAGK